jgi:hypothetical protein
LSLALMTRNNGSSEAIIAPVNTVIMATSAL